MDSLKHKIRTLAREVGFDLVGIASANSFMADEFVTLHRMTQGLLDGLPWYTEARVRRGCDPMELLPGARSIIAVGLGYNLPEKEVEELPGLDGKVARYAWGDDYHSVMKTRLKLFVERLRQYPDRPVAAQWYVDDGPMLDRAVAQRAGLGWFGKNTNILTTSHGSWIFLGQVVTDLELEPNSPLKKSCGSCVRCIEACPTGAIVAPYVIDNTRCISHLTIENRGHIPLELRPFMYDWVFGCDICQEVCPVNIKGAYSREQAFKKRRFSTLDLVGLLDMNEEQFQEQFRSSPVRRAKLWGLQRNACVALGNIGDRAAIPALVRTLNDRHLSGLVRGHAAWALGRIGGTHAIQALESALQCENDPQAVEEIQWALDATPATP